MAKQKQKWTIEEEEALCAGVEKHGHGKWKVILSDPQFASSLANRSNIDLKDKWRNLSASGNASSSREKVRTPRLLGLATNLSVISPEPISVVPLLEYGGTAEPSRSSVDRRTVPEYESMIFEALFSIEDPNGLDANTILDYIEQRYVVPQNFRRSVTSKLRRLVLKGELEKVDHCYKIKNRLLDAETSPLELEDAGLNNPDNLNEQQNAPETTSATPVATETLEDAARYAAYTVAVAENLEQSAAEACEKAEKFAELLEESMAMLKLAEELHEQCSRDGIVLLAP